MLTGKALFTVPIQQTCLVKITLIFSKLDQSFTMWPRKLADKHTAGDAAAQVTFYIHVMLSNLFAKYNDLWKLRLVAGRYHDGTRERDLSTCILQIIFFG